jgi:putative nucleotidyltransferase with HDIG domain
MPSKKRDDDRPRPVSGETSDDVRLPSSADMPASRPRRRGNERPTEIPSSALDVDAIVSVLDSHAELAKVRLRILFPDGRTFFDAHPPDARRGDEEQVPLRLPGHRGMVLRGALPTQQLERVAHVVERVIDLRATSGAHQEALESERKRLSLLFEFSESVCQLAAFDDVITRFLGDVARILNAREATFFALDARRKDLYIRCHHGTLPDVVQNFRLKIGEGIAGAVAADGQARIVNDVANCPDYVPKNNPIHNLIAAPFTVRDALIGVINVNDRGGERPFSNRDLELLQSLARLGGVALDNAKLYAEVRNLLLAVVESLTAAIDAKDTYALGHSQRVAFLCAVLATRLKLVDQERDLLRLAAMLHDIGNLAVSETILKKDGPLTQKERAKIKEHPTLGAAILSPVEQLSAVLPGVVDHHERYDGKGYPRRLKGNEISIQGRIIAIADAFDAMTHDRPFRRCCSPAEALGEITAEAGGQFDPALVPVFVACYRELGLERTPVDELLPKGGPELDF